MRKRIQLAIVVTILFPVLIGCGNSDPPTETKTPDPVSNTPNNQVVSKPDDSPQPKAPDAPIKEGWGNLKGRFAIDGKSPTAAALTINKDKDFCGKHDLRNETLVVNQSNGGIAGVIVWLYAKRSDDLPEAHPSFAETANAEVTLDNLNCRFEPHVCLLRTTQTLLVKNSDSVGHNTKIDTQSNPATNRTIPSGGDLKQVFESAERLPTPVSCSIHPWMQSWLVIQDTPYFAVTDKDGNFEIKNLPSGNWTFQFWHEASGYISEPIVAGKSEEWKKGRVELAIQGDDTLDLGEVKVDASQFE